MLIPASIFPISRIAATDATRYTLNTVHLERSKEGQARAVTTDGKRLLIATWAEEPGDDFPKVEGVDPARVNGFAANIPSDSWELAAKGIPKGRTFRPILRSVLLDELGANGTLSLATTDLENPRHVRVKSAEGHFPPFDGVIPRADGDDAIRVRLSASLLAELLTTMSKMADRGAVKGQNPDGIDITFYGPEKPIRLDVDGANGVQVTGALMPIEPETAYTGAAPFAGRV